MNRFNINRRKLLTAGASSALAVALPAGARELHGGQPWGPREADSPQPLISASLVYLTPAEAAFVDAATERLMPQDNLGPGANQCGVTVFIDHQLAGPYGQAQTWYMQGPWSKGSDTQGFQSRLAPASMYRAAIKAIDQHVDQIQHSQSFAHLSSVAQDALLSAMEHGTVQLNGVDAKAFFKLLLMNTKEGMFSDPIYGGNKDMAGWKMLGFPGARYDYRDWVGKHGQRYTEPPVGLKGRPAWNDKG